MELLRAAQIQQWYGWGSPTKRKCFNKSHVRILRRSSQLEQLHLTNGCKKENKQTTTSFALKIKPFKNIWRWDRHWPSALQGISWPLPAESLCQISADCFDPTNVLTQIKDSRGGEMYCITNDREGLAHYPVWTRFWHLRTCTHWPSMHCLIY